MTAVSDPLPQILEGDPAADALVQVSLDRHGFTLNPTNCDPFAVDATIRRRRRRRRAALSARFQVANCAEPALRAEVRPEAHRRCQAPRAPGDPGDARRRSPGEANTRAVSVTLPGRRAARQLPHRHRLHAGPVRRRHLPRGRRSAGARPRSLAAARRAPQRAASTCAPQRTSCPTWSSTSRARSTSRSPAASTASNGRCAPPSQRSRTCRSPASSSTCSAAKGPPDQQQSLCLKAPRAVVKSVGQNGVTRRTRPLMGTQCGASKRAKRHSGKGA